MEILRYNNNPFLNKALRKIIEKNWNSYKKQINFCLKLLHQTKKKQFNNMNVKKLADNKTFWKSVKPFFSNKGLNSNNIFFWQKKMKQSLTTEKLQLL